MALVRGLQCLPIFFVSRLDERLGLIYVESPVYGRVYVGAAITIRPRWRAGSGQGGLVKRGETLTLSEVSGTVLETLQRELCHERRAEVLLYEWH